MVKTPLTPASPFSPSHRQRLQPVAKPPRHRPRGALAVPALPRRNRLPVLARRHRVDARDHSKDQPLADHLHDDPRRLRPDLLGHRVLQRPGPSRRVDPRGQRLLQREGRKAGAVGFAEFAARAASARGLQHAVDIAPGLIGGGGDAPRRASYSSASVWALIATRERRWRKIRASSAVASPPRNGIDLVPMRDLDLAAGALALARQIEPGEPANAGVTPDKPGGFSRMRGHVEQPFVGGEGDFLLPLVGEGGLAKRGRMRVAGKFNPSRRPHPPACAGPPSPGRERVRPRRTSPKTPPAARSRGGAAGRRGSSASRRRRSSVRSPPSAPRAARSRH